MRTAATIKIKILGLHSLHVTPLGTIPQTEGPAAALITGYPRRPKPSGATAMVAILRATAVPRHASRGRSAFGLAAAASQ